MQNSRGFTLLEVLVAFSIIGLLTGIGFASFVTYSKKQVLDQAVQDLKTGIDQAKFNAVSRVKPNLSPCSDTAPLDRYRIIVAPLATTYLYEIQAGCIVGGVLQWTAPLSSKKRPASISASNISIQFLVLSGIDASDRIVVADGSSNKTICVDLGGNTSVKDGSVSCP